MFVFPVIMNAIQYYVIDSFIKDSSAGEHQLLPSSDHSSEEHDPSDEFNSDNDSDRLSIDENGKHRAAPGIHPVNSTREGKDGTDDDSSTENFSSGNNTAAGSGRRIS